MKVLVTNDLHQTDRSRDSYRFGLYKWLAKQAERCGVKNVIIIGDITDFKDCHSAKLVNRIVKGITTLTSRGITVYIVMGNHDYIDHENPYFKFLSIAPNVFFVHEPTAVRIEKSDVLLLPHTKNHEEDWKPYDFSKFDYIFIHQTVKGVVVENGAKMEDGIAPSVFKKANKVFSGDIHVPQRIGKVEYIGAPYHIKFGDRFKPRVLFIDGDTDRYLYFPTISKHSVSVRSVDELLKMKFIKGDQIKITVPLDRSELVDWESTRSALLKAAGDIGLTVCGIKLVRPTHGPNREGKETGFIKPARGHSIAGAYKAYCNKEGIIGPLYKIGRKLLKKNAPPTA